jgi:hypothetical protein
MAGIKLPPPLITCLPGAALPHRPDTIKGALSHGYFTHNILPHLAPLIRGPSCPTPSTAAVLNSLSTPSSFLWWVVYCHPWQRFPLSYPSFHQLTVRLSPPATRLDSGEASVTWRQWSTTGPIDCRPNKVHRAVHLVHRILSWKIIPSSVKSKSFAPKPLASRKIQV